MFVTYLGHVIVHRAVSPKLSVWVMRKSSSSERRFQKEIGAPLPRHASLYIYISLELAYA